MNDSLLEGLEDYLAGVASPEVTRRVEAALENEPELRQQIMEMRSLNSLFDEIKPVEELEPRPGFYARVMDIVEKERGSSIWQILESLLPPRMAYAGVALAMLLGVYLFVGPKESTAGTESYVAELQEAVPMGAQYASMLDAGMPMPVMGQDVDSNRDAVLGNLTSYVESAEDSEQLKPSGIQ